MNANDLTAELLGTIRAMLTQAQSWAQERPGTGTTPIEDLTDADTNRPDCGERFRYAVIKLERALEAGDAMTVVWTLVELGHAGRDLEIRQRFLVVAEPGAKMAEARRRGGRHGKLSAEQEIEMYSFWASNRNVSATAREFGVSRKAVRDLIKKVGQPGIK